jgi:hypothetical protein
LDPLLEDNNQQEDEVKGNSFFPDHIHHSLKTFWFVSVFVEEQTPTSKKKRNMEPKGTWQRN